MQRVALKARAERGDALWPGGRKEQRLAAGGRKRSHRFHIVAEPHLQHAIRLVEHQRVELIEL